MMSREKNLYLGKPVKSSKIKKDRMKLDLTSENKKKKPKKKREYIRVGTFRSKGQAKNAKKKLGGKIVKRTVRTRAGGPKLESSFSLYKID